MKSETLLPLGKLDPGLRAPDVPLDVTTIGDAAAQVEALGYDALVVEETKDDPYQLLAMAAVATSTLSLGTSVAMAFPRSPTVTALSAWTLQKASAGRAILGLGSQVRGHIRRRYGMEWSAPGPWMRDYVGALRAVWRCWQERTPLDFQSEHYRLNLMVPLFDPGPIAHPDIPVHIAAINPNMCGVAGEVADGIRLHPVCSPKYITEVMAPAVARGAERAGRNAAAVNWCMKPLVATAPDEATLAAVARTVRERVGFYLSTPAYRAAFDVHGWTDEATQAAVLSKAQRWDEISAIVSDEMLHTIATVGTYDQIGGLLGERYGPHIDRIEFSIPVNTPDDGEQLSAILAELGRAERS
ncbi:MAG: TIGR03617 family F420-dependent LLM class oxidoreductase [Acidimicrobiales bacterium]|nr:TIGR03617 family F420-dependent LLM class oxidoreductase [Acidimicrobiales bacterium]MYH74125.1 TIGR03617 family F420-dependent LLM class oxidoreductase [Acidimicrobiales bacterium]MYK72330.1 TIGR03617 family F420-dependent LLM class oxidoreductase [Acidimicrobiales bacterium]